MQRALSIIAAAASLTAAVLCVVLALRQHAAIRSIEDTHDRLTRLEASIGHR